MWTLEIMGLVFIPKFKLELLTKGFLVWTHFKVGRLMSVNSLMVHGWSMAKQTHSGLCIYKENSALYLLIAWRAALHLSITLCNHTPHPREELTEGWISQWSKCPNSQMLQISSFLQGFANTRICLQTES